LCVKSSLYPLCVYPFFAFLGVFLYYSCSSSCVCTWHCHFQIFFQKLFQKSENRIGKNRRSKLEWAKIDTRKSNEPKVKSNNRIWINWFIVSHDQTSLSSPLTCWLFPYFCSSKCACMTLLFSKNWCLPCCLEKFYIFVCRSERPWTLHFWNKKIFTIKGFSEMWKSNGQE
jgi:hypothetical protein